MSDPKATRPAWWAAHEEACQRGQDGYTDPRTGYFVFSRVGLERRGECCGAGCRHCPYGHEKVSDRGAAIQQPAYLLPPRAPLPEEIDLVFWSGGKDAFLALRAWLHAAPTRGEAIEAARARLVLLTTFDARSRRIAHQEIPVSRVIEQARALSLPSFGVPLHAGHDYGERITAALARLAANGQRVRRVIFGDLHLAHIRSWREENFAPLGLERVYPLWGRDYAELLDDLEASGVPVSISAAPEGERAGLDCATVGTPFDRAFAARASEAGWDAFGEKGEFHTLAELWRAKGDPLAQPEPSPEPANQ